MRPLTMLPSLKSRIDFASKSCICNIAIKVSLSDMATISRRRIQPPVRTASPPLQKWGGTVGIIRFQVNRCAWTVDA